jgi:hypothetical protein
MLGEVVRRANGDEAWREVGGVLVDATGAPVGGAYVHALGTDGSYLSRTTTAEDGSYVVHVPNEEVQLVPQKRGYPETAPVTADAGAARRAARQTSRRTEKASNGTVRQREAPAAGGTSFWRVGSPPPLSATPVDVPAGWGPGRAGRAGGAPRAMG